MLPTSDFSLVDNIDLFSFQTANSSDLLTVYAVDSPLPQVGPYVFSMNQTDPEGSATDIYDWIAWGHDTNGDAFAVLYVTAVTGTASAGPELDFISRVDGGPSSETLGAVLQCVQALGNSQLSSLANGEFNTPNDGRRVGQPPASCDEACVQNANGFL